jgi:hypothetical protein
MLVSAGWGFYWRLSAYDALYSISGQVIVPSNGVTGRYEGSRLTMQIDWQLARHLSAHIKGVTRRDVSAGPCAPAHVAEPIADAPGRLSPANSVL